MHGNGGALGVDGAPGAENGGARARGAGRRRRLTRTKAYAEHTTSKTLTNPRAMLEALFHHAPR
eukprot:scaffold1430_cov257-Pinguiococcus_pyrenoidosus.AAC.8